MKTVNDILAYIYKVLNVDEVTGTIDGGVFLHSTPFNDLNTNIEIVHLTAGQRYVKNGGININIVTKDLDNKTPDSLALDAPLREILTILELEEKHKTGGVLIWIVSVDGIKKYLGTPDRSYINIKINYNYV